jgi:D-alanyl-lipoteichoic acid acyltransferase DltB (MBOAT superfamily)
MPTPVEHRAAGGHFLYTFQALGYNIDVYRGEVPAEKRFGKPGVVHPRFSPQLVAGPIDAPSACCRSRAASSLRSGTGVRRPEVDGLGIV